MIDIRLIRLGQFGFSDVIRGSQNRRYTDKSIVDQVIILDSCWKKLKFEVEKLKSIINNMSKKINICKNVEKKNILNRINCSKVKISLLEKKLYVFEESRYQSLTIIGNLIHNSSVFSKSEKDSKFNFFKKNILKRKGPFLYNHVDLLDKVDGVEYQKGGLISGNRGYFLKKIGILLNIALIQYGLDFLIAKGFIPLQTPFFMKKDIMKKCAQLEDFTEQLYCIREETEKFLIATSEQPISAFHINEKLDKKKLPLKYAGFSTCFRKESGSHGKDTSGIFRVHQFEKVEQFIICQSSEFISWTSFEELLENVENFYFSLKIPYRLVNVPSGILNNAASKKFDLLGWFPKSKTFRELVSCSNCTDFQSRRLDISTESIDSINRNKFVHMLNSTLCATTRVICCIVENYQCDFGILIPDVLKSYLGISFVPFNFPKQILM
nr:seryl-tRNA synthetase [Cryptomonas sp.]